MGVLNLSNPVFHYDDPDTGGPLVGGKVYTYVAGTSTLLTTYQDSSLSTANTNPVVLNSYGDAKIWFDQAMKVVVKSADETVTYYTFDNISSVGGTTTVTGSYNSILNGSFESGSADDVTNWTIAPYSGASITIDTTNVSHGKQALKFDGLTGVGGGTATSGYFDVQASSLFNVSFDLMSSNAGVTNTVKIYWYTKADVASSTPSTTLYSEAAANPTSLTSYSYITTVPSDATRATLELTGVASGGGQLDQDTWFDNVFGKVLENTNVLILNDVGTSGTPALNNVTITNAATGNQAKIQGTGEAAGAGLIIEGTGTDSSVNINSQGTGNVLINGYRPEVYFIEEQIISSDVTIDFTTDIDSSFKTYLIEFVNVIPVTNAVVLNMRIQTGGSTWVTTANYDDAGSAGQTEIALSSSTVNTVANGGICGRCHVYDPASSSVKTLMHVRTVYAGSVAATFFGNAGGYDQTTPVTGFRFFFSSGNLASGVIRLYGVT